MISGGFRFIMDSRTFAFLQGLFEHFSHGCGGRTHATDQRWNEAYDEGMNFAEAIRRIVAQK